MSWIGPQMRAPLPQRTKPLRAISKKRRREAKDRAAIRQAVFERDQQCMARGVLDLDCWGVADCHEVIRRGQWGAGYLVLDNCLTLCRRHHEWVGLHPHEAVELGLAKWSWQR